MESNTVRKYKDTFITAVGEPYLSHKTNNKGEIKVIQNQNYKECNAKGELTDFNNDGLEISFVHRCIFNPEVGFIDQTKLSDSCFN